MQFKQGDKVFTMVDAANVRNPKGGTALQGTPICLSGGMLGNLQFGSKGVTDLSITLGLPVAHCHTFISFADHCGCKAP